MTRDPEYRREYVRRWTAEHRAHLRDYWREKYRSDPEYRERKRAMCYRRQTGRERPERLRGRPLGWLSMPAWHADLPRHHADEDMRCAACRQEWPCQVYAMRRAA